MTKYMSRRITCLMTLLALMAAPSLSLRPEASVGGAAAVARAAAPAAVRTTVTQQTGRGWGSIFGCAGCLIAGGLVVAGGPASILIAVNTPGSSVALLACVGSCYEALAS